MLKELFLQQREYLNTFYSDLDLPSCERFMEALLACKGTIFFTGVGKSGFIAHKVAASMMSTGTKALFLSPLDAVHGDLGMLEKDDILVIFSKSGETDELIELLPYVRERGASLFAITSNRNARLAKEVDHVVILPCESELCPFDLAPTISTEVQLLFGDVLTVAVMKAKKFSLDQFAANHPGGRIGRRITLRVRELMRIQEAVPLCSPESRLEEVLVDFTNKRCGCLIVIDEKKNLKGIFTDGDLRRALQQKGERVLQEKIENLMTHTPKAIDVDALCWDAIKLMESDPEHPVMILPVIEKSEVVGIIKLHDLIQEGI